MRAAALLAASLFACGGGRATPASPPVIIRVEQVNSPGIYLIDGDPVHEPEVVPRLRALVSARPGLAATISCVGKCARPPDHLFELVWSAGVQHVTYAPPRLQHAGD